MRLSVILFIVLGLSVILGPMASLGTTYATSYSRLTAMAKEFAEVATDVVGDFGGLVRDLVAESSTVVSHIIDAEYNASSRRILQMESQVTNITLDLLAYTHVASNRSRADVQQLVSSFGGFMQEVINNFGSLAAFYSARLQLELAAKAQTAFNSLMHDRILAIRRPGEMYQLGILNMSRTLNAPLTSNDCLLLAALCDHSADMSSPSWVFVGTYTGGHYSCHSGIRARMYAYRDINGTRTPGLLYWDAYNDTTPASQRKTWQQRCLMELPGWEPSDVDASCTWCSCGFDVRCRAWYRPLLSATGPAQPCMTQPYLDYFSNSPGVTLYFPIYSTSSAAFRGRRWPASSLVGAGATDFSFPSIDAFLAGLLTTNSTRLVVALNDTLLTKVGDANGRLPPSETDVCSSWFLSQSCRPDLRAVGQWLLPRRTTFQGHQLVLLGSLMWDVFPCAIGTLTYFTLVGMNMSLINSPIRAAQRQATSALSDLWTKQVAAMVTVDTDLQAYLTSVEEANVASLGGMQESMSREVEELAQNSQQALLATLDSSNAKLAEMLASSTAEGQQRQGRHLALLASQLGWTVGIVLGILVGILGVGLYGTLSITRSLGTIIQSMEEAATMNLDAVADPMPSWVTEVHRIQVAFHALVLRLVRYKSFMPAALFEQSSGILEGQDSNACQTPQNQTTAPKVPTVRQPGDLQPPLDGVLVSPPAVDAAPVSPLLPPQVARRTVAVLAVNVLGFKGHVFHAAEGCFEAMMNAYLTTVHETVAKVRGNLDLVLGDQVLATFNAHVRCSDAINVAAAAAMELRVVFAQAPAMLSVQMGLAAGKAFAGRVGYDGFRTMLTVGTPMKLAAMLAHLSSFPENSILTDPTVEERAKFHFDMPPVDLVHLPLLGCFAPRLAQGMPVYALLAIKPIAEEEWLYQVETACLPSYWDTIFQRMAAADCHGVVHDALLEYLERHPDDIYAKRLQRRLSSWHPGRGVLLYETADPVSSIADSSFSDPPTPRSIV